MPRVLGCAFNPLSLYFCHRADGVLTAILYEVNNTFGQRHSYLIPLKRTAPAVSDQHCQQRILRLALHGYGYDLPDFASRYRVNALPWRSSRSRPMVDGVKLVAALAGTRSRHERTQHSCASK